jgi:hypothetical protein
MGERKSTLVREQDDSSKVAVTQQGVIGDKLAQIKRAVSASTVFGQDPHDHRRWAQVLRWTGRSIPTVTAGCVGSGHLGGDG